MSKYDAQIIKSKIALGESTANVGTMFINNGNDFADKPAFAQRLADNYHYWNWSILTQDILKLAHYLIKDCGLIGSRLASVSDSNARVAFISSNNYQRLVCEMAVMSCGLVSVPIFAGYPKAQMTKLLDFSEVSLVISDLPKKIADLDPTVLSSRVLLLNSEPALIDKKELTSTRSISFDYYQQVTRDSLSAERESELKSHFVDVQPEQLALIMYTSGTSGFPKGVQLSHKNLMSQQKVLQLLWKPESGMRFLCYLPWHHSFGGLFERFFALHSGGCLAIDDSFGKDVDQLLKNFSEIKPHVYFSVPKIYQEIVARVLTSKKAEQDFFHPELRFVFTAAAPLPLSISDVFKQKGIPVVEGWGLTETSPCCTLTHYANEQVSVSEKKAGLDRVSGVVGRPIPGVELKLGDENEIMVRGENVMKGYFKNPEATSKAFTNDGWFKTGDIGNFTEAGVKIISRKERMFKLDNGEKVYPSQIEDNVNSHCKFIKYTYVFGSGESHPFILIFPNGELLCSTLTASAGSSVCVQPKSAKALSKCLSKCIKDINDARPAGFERIERALVINRELTLEANELTPSFKMIPKQIEEHYRDYINKVRQRKYDELPDDAYVVSLNIKTCEKVS